MTATWTGGRVAESMLCRTIDPALVELKDGRSKSDAEDDEDEDEDEVLPAQGTWGGRDAEADMVVFPGMTC